MAACLYLSGCAQTELETTDGAKSKVTIYGTQEEFGGNRTKTVVGGMTQNGGLVMQWAVGDRVGVFGTAAGNVPFTSTNTAPSDDTGFSGELPAGELPRYVYYPYAEGVNEATNIPLTIPAEQNYTDENSVAQYDAKASAQVEVLSDGTYKCRMRQLVTLVRYEINMDDVRQVIEASGKTVADDEKLTKITLSTDAAMTGDYTYNLTNLDAGLTATSQTQGQLTLRFAATPALQGELVAYAIVAPAALQGKDLLCDLETENFTVKLSTKMLCDFEAGKYYVVPLDASVYNNPDNSTAVEETDNPEQPTEETANCYMITSAGEHSFLATQIGNGDKGIIPGAGFHVTSAKIAPKSAQLLWQDVENFVSDIRLQDGRVHYTANSNVGNAVIAVYSGENCTGDILWSWHIWGVGDTLPEDKMVTNRAGSTFAMMDRTLGAHSLTSYYATLYQWGRKDPVPNSTVYYTAAGTVDIDKAYPVWKQGDGTILNAVQHPGQLINSSSNSLDWLNAENDLLWGDAYASENTGNLSDAICAMTWTDQKTIYDPCPVGYRVAGEYAFTGFLKTTNGTTPQGNSTAKLGYISYVKYAEGWYFKTNTNDTEGIYFPMTGSRSSFDGSLWTAGDGSHTTLNSTASYWTAAPSNLDSRSYRLGIGAYNTQNTSGSYNSYNSVNSHDFSGRSGAFAVRCVREK